MQRVCFLLKVRADKLDEYRRAHENVWPEMLAALSAAGWSNYSLFLRDDGLLVGYLETEDFAKARAAMAATDVNSLVIDAMLNTVSADMLARAPILRTPNAPW